MHRTLAEHLGHRAPRVPLMCRHTPSVWQNWQTGHRGLAELAFTSALLSKAGRRWICDLDAAGFFAKVFRAVAFTFDIGE